MKQVLYVLESARFRQYCLIHFYKRSLVRHLGRMKNHSLMSSVYATLVLSACILQGYSLPKPQSLQRYNAEDYARKFGSAPIDEISNDIDDKMDTSPSAKEDGGLLTTVVEIAMKFAPLIIDTLTGSTGPSQTDRIEGIDLNGEDPFSLRNIAYLGLKLFLAVAGGTSSGIDKSDTVSPMQPVIGALTGSDDPNEVAVMAKQASEVINLVVTLVEALTTSMSQRSFSY